MHGRVVLLGVALLILLAVLLWDEPACGCHGVGWAAPDLDAMHVEAERAALLPRPIKGRATTYDRGRTLLPPKIAPATLARLRGSA